MSTDNEAVVRRLFEAISVFRIVDGTIAEEWTVWDALGLLQQVGAVPVAA